MMLQIFWNTSNGDIPYSSYRETYRDFKKKSQGPIHPDIFRQLETLKHCCVYKFNAFESSQITIVQNDKSIVVIRNI